MSYTLDVCDETASRRFWAKVDKSGEGGCWTWLGARQTSGYGQFSINDRMRSSHRVGWVAINGLLPDELQLDHLCRNRACVNPEHLEPVTRAENMRRTRLLVIGECRKGHRIGSNADVYTNSVTGHQTCRACRRNLKARYRRQRRAQKLQVA